MKHAATVFAIPATFLVVLAVFCGAFAFAGNQISGYPPSRNTMASGHLLSGWMTADAGDATTMSGAGLLGTFTAFDASSAVGIADEHQGFQQDTAATTGSRAYIETDAAFNDNLLNRGYFSVLVRIRDTDHARYFYGLSVTSLEGFDTDTPGSALIGFVFSQPNSDTNWQFISDSAGGGATRINTGVAPGTTTLYRLTFWTPDGGTTVNWQIEDRTSLLARGSTTTDLPPATTDMYVSCGVETAQDDAARQVLVWVYIGAGDTE